MDELSKLVAHLENLKKSGKKQVTLDIDWLLSAIQSRKVTTVPTGETKPKPKAIEISGGDF